MSADPKAAPPPTTHSGHKGVKIFTYPKVIFLIPTLVASLVCGIGMTVINDQTRDPYDLVPATATTTTTRTTSPVATPPATKPADPAPPATATTTPAPASKTTTTTSPTATPTTRASRVPESRRFGSPQNVLAMVFLLVFGLNLLTMALDFPRFTVIALVLLCAAVGFFILWLNVYFELLPPLVRALESVYAVANASFYFLFASIILVIMLVIWATRYLDYWEILPNEILHNHGPFSDLERYPTFNLKFDKEIPDILEYALLRSGRLVLHVPGQNKAIVMDNVLWINHKEEELKKLMSRMEVRVTTDQEAAEPL
jgi:hypothetical protein